MKNEPVLTGAGVVGAIMAVAAFAISMGWMQWGEVQMSAFEAMLIAVVPLAFTLLGGWYGRQRVTPLSKLKGDDK